MSEQRGPPRSVFLFSKNQRFPASEPGNSRTRSGNLGWQAASYYMVSKYDLSNLAHQITNDRFLKKTTGQ